MAWFDYTIDAHGATIIPIAARLSTASLSAVEIDHQISLLKLDLDRLAAKMKAAVALHHGESLGLGKSSNA